MSFVSDRKLFTLRAIPSCLVQYWLPFSTSHKCCMFTTNLLKFDLVLRLLHACFIVWNLHTASCENIAGKSVGCCSCKGQKFSSADLKIFNSFLKKKNRLPKNHSEPRAKNHLSLNAKIYLLTRPSCFVPPKWAENSETRIDWYSVKVCRHKIIIFIESVVKLRHGWMSPSLNGDWNWKVLSHWAWRNTNTLEIYIRVKNFKIGAFWARRGHFSFMKEIWVNFGIWGNWGEFGVLREFGEFNRDWGNLGIGGG